MFRGALLVFMLGGCSQLFGLESPTIAMIDADSVDAPTVDAGGETCLTLALPGSYDDDGDMIVDDQDNCIGIAGTQSDSDLDGIGNSCDSTPTIDERFCVWTFRPPTSTESADVWASSWDTSSPGWSIGSSSLSHTGGTMPEYAQARDAYFTGAGGVAMDTHIRIDNYATPFEVGLELRSKGSAPAISTFTCRFIASGTSATFELLDTGAVVDSYTLPFAAPQQLKAYARLTLIETSSKLTLRCNIIAAILPTPIQLLKDSMMTSSFELQPRVFAANGNVAFDHVTVYKLGM
jgi:hypothetical protein